MLYTARKAMTMDGVRYAARAPIDISKIRPALRQRLLSQRRVVPLEAAVLAEGGASDVAVVTNEAVTAAEESATAAQVAAKVAPKRKRGRPRKSPKGV